MQSTLSSLILGLGLPKVSFSFSLCKQDSFFFNFFFLFWFWFWFCDAYYVGWVPKPVIRGKDSKVFILDFFGSERLRGSGLNVPPSRILTAFGSPFNPMLGFYIDSKRLEIVKRHRASLARTPHGASQLTRGVIWGKDPKHYEGQSSSLSAVADIVPLASTSFGNSFRHQNVQWLGHQDAAQWIELLSTSKFLLGMGDPLLGPSAIDAISCGCVYINPIYPQPVRNGVFPSQHSYAADKIASPYVCSYHIGRRDELIKCVQYALSVTLEPIIPQDFLWEVYLSRVSKLFSLED